MRLKIRSYRGFLLAGVLLIGVLVISACGSGGNGGAVGTTVPQLQTQISGNLQKAGTQVALQMPGIQTQAATAIFGIETQGATTLVPGIKNQLSTLGSKAATAVSSLTAATPKP
jgi:hypothetical protein